MDQRYAYFQNIVENVDAARKAIRTIDETLCYDIDYLENEFIPKLGLNNEMLEQQPSELNSHFGQGLHLWQYPNQLARYLVWLSFNAKQVKRYMEIGCRWGGTFILVTEWLQRIGAPLEFAAAVDPVEATPFIKRYIETSDIPIVYLRQFSTSEEFRRYFDYAKPDCVFIDGDHSINGVMNDHLIARKTADIIVHHDVSSQACPPTTLFWSYLKQAEDRFEAAEFMNQYPSVAGDFLGIGVLKRKAA